MAVGIVLLGVVLWLAIMLGYAVHEMEQPKKRKPPSR
jgi:hypothetical protein